MTSSIRKIISVVCAVALLMSLCTVSFIGSSSALHLDAVESDNTTANFDVVKTYDFNSASGFGYRRFLDGIEFVNGGVKLYNTGNGGGVYFANDPAHSNIINHKNSSARDVLLRLDAGATYKVTFKYKYLAGSSMEGVLLLTAPDATGTQDTSAPVKNGHYITISYSNIASLTYDSPLAADTEIKTATYIFTVGDKSINLGLSPEQNGCYAWIDDFVIEKATSYNVDKTEVYDWTDGDDAGFWNPNNNNFLSDSQLTDNDYNAGSFVDADGLHFSFAHGSSPSTSKGWIKKGLVKRDVNDGGLALSSSEYNYIITMKYKPELIAAGQNAYIGIGYGAQQSTIATIAHGMHNKALDEWQYITAVVDGSKFGASDYLHVTGGSQGGRCSFLIESITVKTVSGSILLLECSAGEIDKDYVVVPAGYAPSDLPIPTNLPESKGFAGWYCGDVACDGSWVAPEGITTLTARTTNTISTVVFDNQGVKTEHNLAVGLELPDPVRPNVNLFFEGWYLEPTFKTKITVVPDYDLTVYAKYNGTYLGFNNTSHVAGQTTAAPTLVQDPADETNQVIRFASGKGARPNFMIPLYDVAGSGSFDLKTKTTYIVTFKAKLTSSDGAVTNVDFYQGDYKSGADTTRTAITGSGNIVTSDEWQNFSVVFTTGDTFYLERVKWSYQNHLFFTIYSDKSDISIYVDDLCIAEALTEAPEGTVAINFETNGSKIPTMYGYVGEKLPELSAPTATSHKFVGWYADKQLSVPFTATTFGTKDVTVYAKWKADPFIVDFTGYNAGVKSERALLTKDENGNDYLDWHYLHGSTTTGDYIQLYRFFLNKDNNHYRVNNGTDYTISFKYKLLDGNVTVAAVTNGMLNGWVEPVVQSTKIGITQLTDEWTTATFKTNISYNVESANYLSLGVAGFGHILFDDITISGGDSFINLYGSTAMYFNTNGGDNLDAVSGDPGETIGKLPTATKKGYSFNGWYTDAECTTPFNQKVWGEEDITLYADWLLGKFNEDFEEYPNSVLAQGISGGYKLYKETSTGYDKANVHKGTTSIYRDGVQLGSKAFTLSRSAELELEIGKQYTLTFYVKPESVTDAAGTISLIGMDSNTGIASPRGSNVITELGNLKVGEWQKVSYTFTATDKYVGISSTAGNNMYLDNFTVTLKGYTGTATGDTSVNPMVIALMVVLAAGALIVTGKKVFEK